jgi:hypothetical protein
MQRNGLSIPINRRRLLGYLGVSVAIAVPALTHASQVANVRQPGGQKQRVPPVKKFVVSF